jgi:hypothetical protein
VFVVVNVGVSYEYDFGLSPLLFRAYRHGPLGADKRWALRTRGTALVLFRVYGTRRGTRPAEHRFRVVPRLPKKKLGFFFHGS